MIDDVLGLVYFISKSDNSFQKITGVSYKNSSRESSLCWACLGRYLKQNNKTYYTPKTKHVTDFIRRTVHGGRVIFFNRKFVSSSFDKIVKILEKYCGSSLPVSD